MGPSVHILFNLLFVSLDMSWVHLIALITQSVISYTDREVLKTINFLLLYGVFIYARSCTSTTVLISKCSADLITKLQSESINYAPRPMFWKSLCSLGN